MIGKSRGVPRDVSKKYNDFRYLTPFPCADQALQLLDKEVLPLKLSKSAMSVSRFDTGQDVQEIASKGIEDGWITIKPLDVECPLRVVASRRIEAVCSTEVRDARRS